MQGSGSRVYGLGGRGFRIEDLNPVSALHVLHVTLKTPFDWPRGQFAELRLAKREFRVHTSQTGESLEIFVNLLAL